MTTCFLCGVETSLVLMNIQGRRHYLKQVALFKTYLAENGDTDTHVETCGDCVHSLKRVWELNQQLEGIRQEIADVVENIVKKRDLGDTLKQDIGLIAPESDPEAQLDFGTEVKEEITGIQDDTEEILPIQDDDEEMPSDQDPEIDLSGKPICPQCRKTFYNAPSLKRHIRDVHGKTLPCPHCSEELSTRDTLQVHVRLVHAEFRPHSCSSCDKGFFKKSDLLRHISFVHDKKSFPCTGCGKGLATQKARAMHEATVCKVEGWTAGRLREEFNITLISCPVGGCDKVFMESKPTELKLHIASHSNFGIQDISGRDPLAIGSSNSGIKVERSESPEIFGSARKFPCPHCGKKLTQRKILTRHIRLIHQGVRPFKCNYCGKTYSCKSNLASHVKYSHTKETFSCSACSKELATKRNCVIHEVTVCKIPDWSEEKLRTEFNVVLVPCKVCGKLFDHLDQRNMKRHIFSHDNSTPRSSTA